MNNMMPLWISDYIVNNGVIVPIANKERLLRMNINEECGDVINKLFDLGITKNSSEKIGFPCFLFNVKGMLKSGVYVPPNRKGLSELEKDLKQAEDNVYTLNAYKNILSVLLSLDFIPALSTDKLNIFDLLNKDIFNRSITLKYFIGSTTPSGLKHSNYCDGLIELELYRLLQQMWFLGEKNHPQCEWMTCFETPLQIWFIICIQRIYLMWKNAISLEPINERGLYNSRINKLKDSTTIIKQEFDKLCEYKELCMISAFNFTVRQLLIDSIPPIATYYYNYLKALKKQAYTVSKLGTGDFISIVKFSLTLSPK